VARETGGVVSTTLQNPFARTTNKTARRPRFSEAVARVGRRAVAQVQATASRLSGSLLTVAGLGCIDVGCFEANTVAGWIVTGLSILTLDWKLDSPPSGGDM
jgi:hypothetical protein